MPSPADVPTVDPRLVESSRERVLAVLADEERTAHELALFYAPDGDYAGPIFDDRTGSTENDLTADDLLAITAMQVQASPRALGRFLKDPAARAEVGRALASSPDVPLWEASAERLIAAQELYRLIKRHLSSGNMWVSASKLCARKRPQLIPVRDSVIVTGLGLPNRKFMQDLLIMRAVLSDTDIRGRLRQAAAPADPNGTTMLRDLPELRLLDAALWMRWSRDGRRRDGVAPTESAGGV